MAPDELYGTNIVLVMLLVAPYLARTRGDGAQSFALKTILAYIKIITCFVVTYREISEFV